MVTTPTEAIRREVIDFFAMPAGRVWAVPLAAAANFLPVEGHLRRPSFLVTAEIGIVKSE